MRLYAAHVGPYVKIGISAQVVMRMRALHRDPNRPADLPADARAQLIGTRVGTVADEQAAHAKLAASRVCGEWYWPTGPVLRYVATLTDDAGESTTRQRAARTFRVSDAADQYVDDRVRDVAGASRAIVLRAMLSVATAHTDEVLAKVRGMIE